MERLGNAGREEYLGRRNVGRIAQGKGGVVWAARIKPTWEKRKRGFERKRAG